MDVCPVDVFEWLLAHGKKGTGNDKIIEKGGEEWDKYRCDKSDMIRESDCIDCMACETACPTKVIKSTRNQYPRLTAAKQSPSSLEIGLRLGLPPKRRAPCPAEGLRSAGRVVG